MCELSKWKLVDATRSALYIKTVKKWIEWLNGADEPSHLTEQAKSMAIHQVMFPQETILDGQTWTLTCYLLSHQYTLELISLKHYMPNTPVVKTLQTFHFPKAMQDSSVLRFHTHSLEQHQLPREVKPYSPTKKTSAEPLLNQS